MSATLLAPAERLAGRAIPRIIPALPDVLKRMLSGGKAITIDGNTLDPTLQLLLAAQRASGAQGLVIREDPVATRAHARETYLALTAPSVPVEECQLLIPGPAGPIPARYYRLPVTAPAPLLVFYHGGGYVFGELDLYEALCRQICRDGAVHVLSVDYRLAPEHKAPAAADDALAAFQWAAEHAEELGAAPGRIAVGGDSAGGGLSAIVSQLARDYGGPLPALQWLIYPVTELGSKTRSRRLFGDGFLLTQHDTDWFDRQYLQGSGLSIKDPLVSPLHAEDLSGLPPAVVITAGFDPLRDEGNQYAAAMRAAGVIVDQREMHTLTHGFVNLSALGGACSVAIAACISALRAHLSRP
jgi:acetyl esterase